MSRYEVKVWATIIVHTNSNEEAIEEAMETIERNWDSYDTLNWRAIIIPEEPETSLGIIIKEAYNSSVHKGD